MAYRKTEGVLKIIKGVTKMVAIGIPALLSLGSISSGLTVTFVGSGRYSNAIDDFRTSDTYAERHINDFENYKSQFDNGEISKEEYKENLEYMSSQQYIVDLINEDREENAELQSILKNGNLFVGVGLGVFAAFWPIFIGSVFFYVFKAGDFWDKAKDDIIEGRKLIKSGNHEKKSDDNIDESNSNINGAYKEDEEKIESLDEDYL